MFVKKSFYNLIFFKRECACVWACALFFSFSFFLLKYFFQLQLHHPTYCYVRVTAPKPKTTWRQYWIGWTVSSGMRSGGLETTQNGRISFPQIPVCTIHEYQTWTGPLLSEWDFLWCATFTKGKSFVVMHSLVYWCTVRSFSWLFVMYSF